MKQRKGFRNAMLIIIIVILVGALGYVTLVKKPVNISKIDCGVIKDTLQQNIQVACMSKALRTCTSAIMYDSSQNTVAQKSYEILGSESQYCQVRHRQHTKPPQFSSICKYSLDLISKTDSTLESKNESDKLFSIVVMQNGFSCQ